MISILQQPNRVEMVLHPVLLKPCHVNTNKVFINLTKGRGALKKFLETKILTKPEGLVLAFITDQNYFKIKFLSLSE